MISDPGPRRAGHLSTRQPGCSPARKGQSQWSRRAEGEFDLGLLGFRSIGREREGFLPDAAYHASVAGARRLEPFLLERIRLVDEARPVSPLTGGAIYLQSPQSPRRGSFGVTSRTLRRGSRSILQQSRGACLSLAKEDALEDVERVVQGLRASIIADTIDSF